jgi:hypothetical protein
MDNPQHYQPLSHALNPPNATSTSQVSYQAYDPAGPSNGVPITARAEEEEEEEEDDDDEGLVEEQLNERDAAERDHHRAGGNDASSKPQSNRQVACSTDSPVKVSFD